MRYPFDWKKVNEDTDRMWVPGGWVVRVFTLKVKRNGYQDIHVRSDEPPSLVFVPDPERSWEI